MHRLKILHLLPQLEGGGVERGVVDLAGKQKALGHAVWVSSSGGGMVKELESTNIPHITYPWHLKNPLTWQRRAKHLAQLMQQLKIDILHPHSRIPYWLAYLANKRHRCPTVTTCYGGHGMGPLSLKKPYNRSITTGDRVVATSQTMLRYLQDHFPNITHKVRHVPRGVNLNHFCSPPSADVQALREQWRLDERPSLLFPARISRKKGQHLLIEALQHLSADEAVQVVFVGTNNNPKYLGALNALSVACPPWHTVRYQAHCDDMPCAYLATDIAINAALKPEPFGRAPLEAGIMGRLTIAPDAGGFQETMIHGQTGWRFKAGDALDLAKQIKCFLKLSPTQKQHMEVASQRHIRENFTLDQMAARTMAIYEELLQAKVKAHTDAA